MEKEEMEMYLESYKDEIFCYASFFKEIRKALKNDTSIFIEKKVIVDLVTTLEIDSNKIYEKYPKIF